MSKSQTKPEPKATADNIPVYCAHDAIVKTADMKPNPKNPNQHPEEQLRASAPSYAPQAGETR